MRGRMLDMGIIHYTVSSRLLSAKKQYIKSWKTLIQTSRDCSLKKQKWTCTKYIIIRILIIELVWFGKIKCKWSKKHSWLRTKENTIFPCDVLSIHKGGSPCYHLCSIKTLPDPTVLATRPLLSSYPSSLGDFYGYESLLRKQEDLSSNPQHVHKSRARLCRGGIQWARDAPGSSLNSQPS